MPKVRLWSQARLPVEDNSGVPLAIKAAVVARGTTMGDNYAIFTDAASDLPTELIEKHKLFVLPIHFDIGGKNYQHYPDGRELGYADFYSMLRSGAIARTSQINNWEYQQFFEPAVKCGLDIIYICFSSALSGMYNASVAAASELMERYPGRKVYCIDSRCASAGEGMLVHYAALKKQEGLSLEELKEWVVQERDHLCHWFTVDDLNYLKKGGRLSSSSAIIGTMLAVKPILHVNKDGQLVPRGKVRGRRKALTEIAERMEKSCVKPQEQTVFIGHGDCIHDAETVSSLVKQRLGVKDVVISYIGPIIGAHTGPDVLTLCFFGEK
jgi:DegV family protein with EDD domain